MAKKPTPKPPMKGGKAPMPSGNPFGGAPATPFGAPTPPMAPPMRGQTPPMPPTKGGKQPPPKKKG